MVTYKYIQVHTSTYGRRWESLALSPSWGMEGKTRSSPQPLRYSMRCNNGVRWGSVQSGGTLGSAYPPLPFPSLPFPVLCGAPVIAASQPASRRRKTTITQRGPVQGTTAIQKSIITYVLRSILTPPPPASYPRPCGEGTRAYGGGGGWRHGHDGPWTGLRQRR
jgi:hypothetical protein